MEKTIEEIMEKLKKIKIDYIKEVDGKQYLVNKEDNKTYELAKEFDVFNNEILGDIRTLKIGNEYYFLADDIIKALGYKELNETIDLYCKAVFKLGVKEKDEELKVLNLIWEFDVYNLIIKSQLNPIKKHVCYLEVEKYVSNNM